VIHRDIATRNILVGEHYCKFISFSRPFPFPFFISDELSLLAVFLSDFGLSRVKEQDVNTTVSNVGPVKVIFLFF